MCLISASCLALTAAVKSVKLPNLISAASMLFEFHLKFSYPAFCTLFGYKLHEDSPIQNFENTY